MAQNITIAGATYSAVPSIECPKQGGGTAIFADPSGTTATASDVASGKYFLDSSGTLTAGTASGGGGVTIKSVTKTIGSSNVTSLQFTGLTHEPELFSFALDLGNNTYLTGSSTKFLSSGICDGETLYTTCVSKSGSSPRETCYNTATWSYSSGTLTITSSQTIGYFASGKTYMLIYAY